MARRPKKTRPKKTNPKTNPPPTTPPWEWINPPPPQTAEEWFRRKMMVASGMFPRRWLETPPTAPTRSPGTPTAAAVAPRRRPGGQRKVDLDDFAARGDGLSVEEQMTLFGISYTTAIRYRRELRRKRREQAKVTNRGHE